RRERTGVLNVAISLQHPGSKEGVPSFRKGSVKFEPAQFVVTFAAMEPVDCQFSPRPFAGSALACLTLQFHCNIPAQKRAFPHSAKAPSNSSQLDLPLPLRNG
ncbi:MAG: hypothetical protein K2P38_16180, partial [Lachnospiraceae bacterium]|nr:hypothetical protein [Lachnospiraceae bacterium]